MRAVVQRVSRASVKVDGQLTGEIAQGLLVLLGVAQEDGEADVAYLADKVAGLRIFEDEAGKMNLSVGEVGGAVAGGVAVHPVRRCAAGQAAIVRRGGASRAGQGAV